MKLLSLIFLFFVTLNATSIQNIDIVANDELIEISFILDSKFESKVVKQDSDDFSTIILKDIDYDKNKISTKTKLIRQIEVFQQNKDVYVIFAVDNFNLDYSLEVMNSDNILKILIKPKSTITSSLLSNPNNSLESAISAIKNQTNSQNLPSNNPSSPMKLDSWRYVAVISILIILLIALVVIKRKMQTKSQNMEFSYFKKPNPPTKNNTNISVSRVINLDLKNKIIVLDSGSFQYMLFIGQNNSFIIDRLENKKQNDSDDDSFTKLLERKEAKLSYFLKDDKDEEK